MVAIDRAALEPASLSVAQQVITGWSSPSGPTAATWSVIRGVAALLSSAELPPDGSGGLALVATPSMGLIKGTIGADFVIPCVDYVLTATLSGSSYRIAVADCQRMVWRDGGWRIGPGSEPAPAPSIWPGTQASFDVGYQWLETVR
jgi:hypothetical protein